MTRDEIIRMATNDWFDIIGLSASVREQFPQLKELIKKIRAKSKNAHVGIIIGSPVFNQFPELVDDLGADMIGIDAADALEKATFYVERLRQAKEYFQKYSLKPYFSRLAASILVI